jgi:hypothetical protein
MVCAVSQTRGYCWRTYFNTTKQKFLERLFQSLGAFKQAIGETAFQRLRVRQQYPAVFEII